MVVYYIVKCLITVKNTFSIYHTSLKLFRQFSSQSYLHVKLAQHFGPGEDTKWDLVDAVVLHVEGVNGGELRRPTHRVGLEAVPRQCKTCQVHQT